MTQKRYVFGPVRERPDLRNTCPLRRFQAQKDPKKVRIWEVGGRGGGGCGLGTARPRKYVPLYGVFRPKKSPKKVRIGEVGGGNGPTSEIRALYGVFGPKDRKKDVFGRSAGGGSGPGTARPKKYVPFTAFSGPKRPKKGTYLGGWRGGGGSCPGTADLRNTCPLRRFQAQKDPKKVRIWEGGGVRSGNGPFQVQKDPKIRERPDLRNTCPLRRFQAKKTQKRYVFGRSAGVRRSRPPERVQVFFAKCFMLLFSSLLRGLWAWGFRVAQGVRFFCGTVRTANRTVRNRRSNRNRRTEPQKQKP